MARGRTTAGWVVLAVALVLAYWGLYALFTRLSAEPDDRLLLPGLSVALAIVALALVGVLVRNLVRLVIERKRGIFGSRLRTKLVFFLLAMVLLPSTFLFYGSAQVIKQTVEAILRTPMEELVHQSDEIVDQWNEYFKGQALDRARGLAAQVVDERLLLDERSDDLQQVLDRWKFEHRLHVVRVSFADGRILEASDPQSDDATRSDLDALVSTLTDDVHRREGPASRLDHLGDALLAQAAVPVLNDAIASGDPAAVIAVGALLPTPLAGNLEGFAEAEQTYRQFRAQRRELIRAYLTLIALIYVVTLFIATWIGFYVSRRITGPIQELATAAREISAGNLEVRVQAEAGDEVGQLVEAFNEMAGELQENREVITRSTADLRRSNRALDERRRYIETLLEKLSTAVFSLDSDGRVTTVNPAVTKILGVHLVMGDDPVIVFERHGLEPLIEVLDAARKTGGEQSRSDLSVKVGESTLHLAVQVTPLRGAQAESAGTLVMFEDLADLMRAQRAAAWREVAKRIAHEIKNPLTPIQLAAQRLRKRFAEGGKDLDKILPEATSSIEREVGALKRLVDEFSRFARMPEISPRQVRFQEIVESVLALYRGSTDVRWDVDLDPGIGDVFLDPEQMRRVLINLIDNALAAMQGQGAIHILASSLPGGLLRLELADTGPGIPPGDRDKMFIPYFSTKRRGTGLGLAIVHRVVTDHRGTIRIEDNEPHGARFIIEIPR
jgi:two-component system nitrogen regulation sensor histidine kinase NtrY